MKIKSILCSLAAGMLVMGMTACGSKSGSTEDAEKKDSTEVSKDNAKDAVIEVTAENQEEILMLTNEMDSPVKPAIVDFGATWCGPCQQFKPTFHAIAAKYKDQIDFYAVDVDVCEDLAKHFQVESVPTIIFAKDGAIVNTQVGAMSEEEFETLVKSLL